VEDGQLLTAELPLLVERHNMIARKLVAQA